MSTVIRNVIRDLRPIRRPARILYLGAGFWLVSAAIHLGVLAVDGWQLSGAVSFRKPLTFSLSFGLLLATVGWVLDRLPDRPRLAGALAWTAVVSASIEVALITMQAWRGRASHFNVFESGDAMIFNTMGAMIGVFSLCLVGVLAWSLIERPADRLVRLAVIGGMLLVTTGLGFGAWIIQLGLEFVDANSTVPETVTSGSEGVAKFPHAVAFHGVQVFILTAVMLRRGRLPERDQLVTMRLVFWSYVGVLVLASAQTVAGSAPLDPTPMVIGLVLLLGGVAVGLVRTTRALVPLQEAPVG